jgi:hypothetical protein
MFRYQGSGTAHYIYDDIRDDVKRTYVEEIVKSWLPAIYDPTVSNPLYSIFVKTGLGRGGGNHYILAQ